MSQPSKPAWAANLMPVGLNYYAGIVENAEDLLEYHKVVTQSSFGTTDFRVPDAESAGLTSRQLKEKKKQTLAQLQKALSNVASSPGHFFQLLNARGRGKKTAWYSLHG